MGTQKMNLVIGTAVPAEQIERFSTRVPKYASVITAANELEVGKAFTVGLEAGVEAGSKAHIDLRNRVSAAVKRLANPELRPFLRISMCNDGVLIERRAKPFGGIPKGAAADVKPPKAAKAPKAPKAKKASKKTKK